jgi:23S rRNA (adenine2503-C2)-methyltransferase
VEILADIKSLVGLTVQQLQELFKSYNQPFYRAVQVYKWIHHHQVHSFENMTNIPKSFRNQLADRFGLHTLNVDTRQESSDGTIKYLWRLNDGKHIESVFIPEESRNTICISSQVGCALGCEFCATAQMGFLRNLTPGEIVEQVIHVQQDTGKKVTNVVFMGMGEPFLNYPRVIQASKIFHDPEGLAIAAKKITISTVGVVPRIHQFTVESRPFSLAISLHAPTQELRQQIMPIAKNFPLGKLMESARHYTHQLPHRRITFEYVLLKDVNDTPAVAKQLLKLLAPLRCKLNLIPYNDTGLGFQTPSEERILQFARVLESAPFAIMLRKNRGNDISAACGQLFFKTKAQEKPRFIKTSQEAFAS